MQRIQEVQLKPQEGPEDADGSQLSSSWMQKRKVQRAFMEAQKVWEHVKDRVRRDIQQKTVDAFSRRRRRRVAFKECPDVAMAEFKDVGTPACTREEKQSTEHVKGSSV